MRRSPRARGVFSRIRQAASAVIWNHTWRPSGLSSAPYQRVRPLGSRPEARGVRVRGAPRLVLALPFDNDRQPVVGPHVPPQIIHFEQVRTRTNGPVEGINNKLRVIARRAYGFHSPGALISMLFLCCGGIELAPPLPARI